MNQRGSISASWIASSVAVVIAAIALLAGAARAVQPQFGTSTCTNCVGGVCWSSTPTVIPSPPGNGYPWADPLVQSPDGTFEIPNWSIVQRFEGNQWCIYYIDAICRWVRMLNCHGRPFYVWEVIGTREELGECFPVPSPDPRLENPAPPGGGAPVVIPAGPSTGSMWNCHAASTGLGPGAPTPPQPQCLPAPRGSNTTPYTPKPTVPTGSTGFWDGYGTSITQNPCWREFECPDASAEAGTVVLLWRAPKNRDGSRDTSKARPVHSARSNGNGSYQSKNGGRPLNSAATKQQAFGEYEEHSSAAETYYRCYAYVCD